MEKVKTVKSVLPLLNSNKLNGDMFVYPTSMDSEIDQRPYNLLNLSVSVISLSDIVSCYCTRKYKKVLITQDEEIKIGKQFFEKLLKMQNSRAEVASAVHLRYFLVKTDSF